MSTTIFCTFEQQDLADLAVGKLRDSDLGIKSIHYIGAYREQENPAATSSIFIFPSSANAAPVPSRPVTLKIVCSDAKSDALVSRLINMRGYEIIKTR